MGKTDFANAVAAVRSVEPHLLDRNDFEKMISAKTVSEAEAALAAHGYDLESGSAVEAIDDEQQRVWDFLKTYLGGSDTALCILLYKNDFQNLKAALKAIMSDTDPKRLYVYPTLVDSDELYSSVLERKFENLPEHMRSAAKEAYSVITESGDGQLAEMIIDRAALEAMAKDALKYGDEFFIEYTRELTVGANVKTAYRCAAMGKSVSFIKSALAPCEDLDCDELTEAARKGTQSVLDYLKQTSYRELGEAFEQSAAAFERLCDDRITQLIQDARYESFGIKPLAAYYLAKEAEIKNLRILFTCKRLGIQKEIITERTRKLYDDL